MISRIIFYVISKWNLSRKGQITSTSQIGTWIKFICSQEQINSIVEVGTWNGAGSSNLIAKSIESQRFESENLKVIGIEIDYKMYKKAKKRLRKYSFFKVIHGRIVDENELDTFNLSREEKEWIKVDRNNIKSCPNVYEFLPQRIDLLILDGGEFSTYAEFKKLENRLTNFVILDDINLRKGKRIIDEIMNSKKYNILFLSEERNGSAIFKLNELSF